MPASVANSYRRRLLDEGVIVPAGHGMIEFADTGVRERAQAHHAELETRRAGFSEQRLSPYDNRCSENQGRGFF